MFMPAAAIDDVPAGAVRFYNDFNFNFNFQRPAT